MALLDDIRNHLAVMNPGQRARRGALLLREAAAEIERLRAITASESDRPQAIDPCDLHARESQRLQPDRTPDEPSTPSEGTRQSQGTSEPVAWLAFAADGSEDADVYMTPGEARHAADEWNWCIAPLYRSPTLTDAEREALEWAMQEAGGASLRAQTLLGLLERSQTVTQ